MRKIFKFNKYAILIVFGCLFMSVGYAAISAVNLNITGDATATAPNTVFISDVSCEDVDDTSMEINSLVGTMMNSSLYIRYRDVSLPCRVTIYNNTNTTYYYDDTVYDDDDLFYDNDQITFNVDLAKNTALGPQESVTFNIEFLYATTTPTNYYLNSYIKFRFIADTLSSKWYENCSKGLDTIRCKLITAETPYSDKSSSTYVSSSSGINFNANSSTTNGRGLYYVGDTTRTEDLDGDGEGDRLYYYRGNVSNNYLLFSGFCWRVVRINEDGSVKLIYDGTQTNGSCPQSGTNVYTGSGTFNSSTTRDNALVGYMYGSTGASSYANAHTNTKSSTIKTSLDNWYNTNLSSNSSYLADYRFCADRTLSSGSGYGTRTSVYAPENRFYANSSNQVPNIKCDQDNDKFSVDSENGNGALTYPIGLLTADEANYAGVRYSSSGTNTDSFLYTSYYFWLLSPGDVDSSGVWMYLINNSGNMRLQVGSSTSTTVYYRPVINILGNSKYSSGTGTYNDPYVISGFGVDTGDGSGGSEPGGGDEPDPPTPVSQLWYENCTGSTQLNCTMLSTSSPTIDSSISFSSFSSSSNGLGLYYTSDLTKTEDTNNDGEGERVYYYRGKVTDNFVLFANYCWRIVRTNEDGTVRMIFGGSPTNGSCPRNGTAVSIGNSAFNSNASDNAYVGYMYGTVGASSYDATHRNTNNSTIKTAVDNWYNSNLSSYSSYLADEIFCNDRALYSGNGYGTSSTVYAGNNRLNSNKNPTLKCSQDNDKFTVNSSNGNGALSYPIGIITADEINYAGSMFNTSTSGANNSYLYTGAGLWTMTPSDYYRGDFYNFYLNTSGELRIANDLTTSYSVRPVINLLSTVVVTGGNGTYNSPFQVALQ